MKTIAVAEGDGIGHEVIPVARQVLELLHPEYEFFSVDMGYGRWEKTGCPCNDHEIAALKNADAVLFDRHHLLVLDAWLLADAHHRRDIRAVNVGVEQSDPRALGRMMKEMKGEIGEEMGGEFDEVVDRLEKGQTPDEIEQSFPDPDGDGDAVG